MRIDSMGKFVKQCLRLEQKAVRNDDIVAALVLCEGTNGGGMGVYGILCSETANQFDSDGVDIAIW